MRMQIVPYDPAWPVTFETLRLELTEALRLVDIVAIEHVGSTAVPGLAAKPVIDIDVVVVSGQVGATIEALEAASYAHRGELGVPDRHAFVAPDDGPRRHVYVVVDGSLALRNHLGIRDVLRGDAELRHRYGDLKRALSQRDYESADQYVADKSELLQVLLERAGISDQERSAIKNINIVPTDPQP